MEVSEVRGGLGVVIEQVAQASNEASKSIANRSFLKWNAKAKKR